MATTVGTGVGNWDIVGGATHDSPSVTVSAGQAWVVLGGYGDGGVSSAALLSSIVWDPAGANEALTIAENVRLNFSGVWVAYILAPTPGTGVFRATYSPAPNENNWIAAVPLTADGPLSFGASGNALDNNTTINTDGTGICLDSMMDGNTTSAVADTADQTYPTVTGLTLPVSGDGFYSGGVTYKTPGASTTNMNWTSTDQPRHCMIHIAEGPAGGGGSPIPVIEPILRHIGGLG